MSDAPKPGHVAWHDLTVENADEVRDFYAAVVGWKVSPADMGGYQDYSMVSPDGDAAVGVCHARGANADIPPQWLMYVIVEDLDAALARCTELGGALVAGPREQGDARFAVIRDPAGAVCALYQP